eukprot:486983-Prymnesium_polylepis.1
MAGTSNEWATPHKRQPCQSGSVTNTHSRALVLGRAGGASPRTHSFAFFVNCSNPLDNVFELS